MGRRRRRRGGRRRRGRRRRRLSERLWVLGKVKEEMGLGLSLMSESSIGDNMFL